MHISDYHFGSITVDGQTYKSDLVILPDAILPSWWRKSGHKLLSEDLVKVVAAAPEVLVIGTGAFGLMRVPETTRVFLEDNGIEPVILKSKEAAARFNELAKTRRAAGAFHLTC